MSVNIIYSSGRFGNMMFQYSIGRLFAETHGYEFNRKNIPEKWRDVISVTEPKAGRVVDTPVIDIVDRCGCPWRNPNVKLESSPLLDNFETTPPLAKYVFNSGTAERADILTRYYDQVRGFFVTKNKFELGENDLVMHIRLKDFLKNNKGIDQSFYLNVLKRQPYDNVYIVYENLECKLFQDYCECFAKYKPKFISSSVGDDWNFIRSANHIACSNSTFAWWAGFLSDAKHVYLPGPGNTYTTEQSRVKYWLCLMYNNWGSYKINSCTPNTTEIVPSEPIVMKNVERRDLNRKVAPSWWNNAYHNKPLVVEFRNKYMKYKGEV